MNGRWLPMGLAIGPFLSGGRPQARRPVAGACRRVVRAPPAAATGPMTAAILIGATLPQAAAWSGGTLIGVLIGPVLDRPGALGLDAMFPAFFAVLLAGEARGEAADDAPAADGRCHRARADAVRAARRSGPGRVGRRAASGLRWRPATVARLGPRWRRAS